MAASERLCLMDWWPGQIGLVKSHSAIGRGILLMQWMSGGWTDPGLAGWVPVVTGREYGQIGEAQPRGYQVVPMHYPPADGWWVPHSRLPQGKPRPGQWLRITRPADRKARP